MERSQRGDNWTLIEGHSQPTVSRGGFSRPDVVVAERCRIEGAFYCEGTVEFHGEINGELRSAGRLTIGEAATVNASIVGEDVEVFGKVVGDIEATARIKLQGGASVSGNLRSPRIAICDGVDFTGCCEMPSAG